ncbi:nucleotide sugar dehydrogenase [Halosimplex pelagicum]|uniref:UDP-N-acetyl-D-mannosamine dehydrogenase n=1 Tax=Halosimplex pelagicum TaxID=869886 RepID=A0A7D5T2J9_9EURY|nr:nucleotide sugar dehydrogenase [Halosimplex pelagicum]QLH81211.1 nucleotide sugar dehydrogenase [Halosimplex pelagicum]
MQTSDDTFAIIGLGEVGLRLAIALVDSDYSVTGVDIDDTRVEELRAGNSYIQDIPSEEIERIHGRDFSVTTSYEDLRSASYFAVCVPTPLQKAGQPDISYVVAAVESLVPILTSGDTVIIESTVYPGATEDLIAPIIEDEGFEIGSDIHLAFSPERIDPNNEEYTLAEIPKVIGGATPECATRVEAVYSEIFEDIVHVNSTTEAEMTKILENTFRNVNIALVNELVKVADNLNIDFWTVIEAAKTKPYGFMPFYPGPGLGGHCIPVDPLYLSWTARQNGLKTPLIDLADKTNREMSEYVVTRTMRHLNEFGTPLSGASVLVLGVTYKPDVPDVRNSPGVDIIDHLEDHNADVSYHDPYIKTVEVPGQGEYESETLDAEILSRTDCVVIVADHSAYDFEWIASQAPLVFDTRNATAQLEDNSIRRL